MQHTIIVPAFTFNKIKEGIKKVDIRLFDKSIQKIRINDTIIYQEQDIKNQIECNVKGIVLFETFEELIEHIPSQLIGYQDKKEVIIRVERMYPKDFRQSFFACGLFIDIVSDIQKEREKSIQYTEEKNKEDIKINMKSSSEKQKKQLNSKKDHLLYEISNYQRD